MQNKEGMEGMTVPRPHGLPSRLMYEDFIFQNSVGEGQYGSVWRCVDRRTGETFACKQMKKSKHPKSVDRETICFVRVQSHKNVVRLENLYEDAESIYFLMELCTGGDLLPVICQSGGLDEKYSSSVFIQLVEAVQHCHARGVVHRDIKPENVLLDTPVDGVPTVKLADFGLATYLRKGRLAQGWVGSPPYEAPEVIELKAYDYSADVWSLGVVLYGMLSANWPSFLQGRKFNKDVDFQAPVWDPVSTEAKSLITRMLSTDPSERPTATQILHDPWLAMQLPGRFNRRGLAAECLSPLPPPALPVEFLPAITVNTHMDTCQQAAAAEGDRAKKVKEAEGSFGNWLHVAEHHQAEKVEVKDDPMSLDFFVDSWKFLSGTSSSVAKAVPPTAPFSDSSTNSPPSSPESKPTLAPVHVPRPGVARPNRSIRKHLGKRFLQMVQDTLAPKPACAGMAPSASGGEVKATKKPDWLWSHPTDLKRPSTARH